MPEKKIRKKIEINTNIDFEIRNPVLKRVFSLLLAALFLFECGYQVFVLVKNRETLVTETAVKRTVSQNITADAYVIREEVLLEGAGAGTMVPDFANGSKVSVNDRVARVFANASDAQNAVAYNENEALIAYYEDVAALSKDNLVGGFQVYTSSVTDRLLNIQKDVNSGNLSALSEDVTALSESITKRQIAVGDPVDVSSALQTLYETKNTLGASLGKYSEIYTHYAGYYVNTCDGYENNYQWTSPDNVTREDVENLLNATPKEKSAGVGKIITAFNWYLVCNVSSADADNLKVGNNVKVTIDSLGSKVLSLRLKAVNRTQDNTVVTLVFSCNLMDEEMAALRKTQVKIRIKELTGFVINQKALRTVNGEKGVYIQLGNIVRFRKIKEIPMEGDIILVSADETESGYLRLYDEIITEGTDLYDGKIID